MCSVDDKESQSYLDTYYHSQRGCHDNPEYQRNLHGYVVVRIVEPEIIFYPVQFVLEDLSPQKEPRLAPGKARIDRQTMNYLLVRLDPTLMSTTDGRTERYLLARNRPQD